MTSAQVVETSVTNNSSSQNYSHPDDHTIRTICVCLFVCHSVCGPVGVEDRNKIPDARMTASTIYNSNCFPYYGRLNENRGYRAWCTKTTTDRTDYLQVDMGAMQSLCAVATQGASGSDWITSYKVHLSTDGITWNSYKEDNVEKVVSELLACDRENFCTLLVRQSWTVYFR